MTGSEQNPSLQRVQLQAAFLLHHRPYRETSRILEFFTREHGRITLFARGSRGAKARLNSVLQPFNKLLISWSGRGDAGNLTGAEVDGVVQRMPAERSLSGLYMNELLTAVLHRHDPQAEVFDLYARTVDALRTLAEEARTLRIFEKRLLDSLGYGLSLEREALTGTAIEASCVYRYRVDQGFVAADGVAEGSLLFSGASLLSLAREDLQDAGSRADARRLMRAALDHCLEGRQLRSREILVELRRLNSVAGHSKRSSEN